MAKKIAIIGGGASGLVAAISAARLGAKVTIYERCDRVAKKILATGNGRCNMSNINASTENYHGKNPQFINGVMHQFWVAETIDFFEELGIVAKTENDGKIFPYSLQASAVSDVLRAESERLNIQIICKFEVCDIQKNKNSFLLTSFTGEKAVADCVVIASGGKASPNLGSNGSGYALAEKLGHKKTLLYPALVQIKTKGTVAKSLQGLKIQANAKFYENNKFIKETEGEVLFADYGLSGPPIFDLSRTASTSKKGEIRLDLMKEYSFEEVYAMLKKRKSSHVTLENYFVGMLPKKLGQILLKSCGISPLSQKSAILTKDELQSLSRVIKAWSFFTDGTMSWNNAQVTAGGIETSGINPKTMESQITQGIFFSGEILDIDGDCGGYNLQWAWSSGYIAGKNAALK